ncbi:hypothetical protein LOTGIDRAFT_237893 [Lottia gigantea]|uniref:Tetraspanin n=1 Tax=Lottia gigantea TaxID=225164 RepID=V4AYI1_LOTGI|nr:hypothetical protein LOTGIDRAFT_237893 [Lottia gigantea]ESP02668.1 hypothetical protein LOTGIDRAFT_237893 [Lottia gigantea]
MLQGSGARCVKYTLYFLNVIFFIMGVASIGIGVFLLVDEEHMTNMVTFTISGDNPETSDPGLLFSICIIFIVIGALLVLLSFFGCLGTMKEIRCLLALYLGLLFMVFVVQIAVLALSIVFHMRVTETLESSLYSNLKLSYDNYYNTSDVFTRGFDYSMVYFECCGIRNYTEFQKRELVPKWSHFNSQLVPAHCCKLNKEAFYTERLMRLEESSCPTKLLASNIDTPCYDKILDWNTLRSTMLIAVAAVTLAFELIGMMLTCCLISCIKNIYNET